jgi:hypothetical protein
VVFRTPFVRCKSDQIDALIAENPPLVYILANARPHSLSRRPTSGEGTQARDRTGESRLRPRQHRAIRRAPNIATKAAHLSENCIDYAYGRNLGELNANRKRLRKDRSRQTFRSRFNPPATWAAGGAFSQLESVMRQGTVRWPLQIVTPSVSV